MLFLDRLFYNCQTEPDRLAIEFSYPERTIKISYAELARNVETHAHYLLSLGVSPGDRVAIQLPKSLTFIFLHLAAMRLGAISLPLNPDYSEQELEFFLNDSEAKVFFTDRSTQARLKTMLGHLAHLEHRIFIDSQLGLALSSKPSLPVPLAQDADATALMIYTSGTTGRPKGAELSHANLSANLAALDSAWQWQKDDVVLHCLPIFHTHGLVVALHGALHAAASTVMLARFEASQTLTLLLSKRFSVFMAVPTMHSKLLAEAGKQRYDLSFMRLMTSGSAALPEDLFKRFQEVFNYTLLERYGMTETGMNLSNPYLGERRLGSVGLPLAGVEARVVHPETLEVLPSGEIGEIQIRGKHVFKGYWRQSEKTAEAFTPDGWLRTGDLGLCAEDGYYYLKGRSKELIISGGLNVYPPEVEKVLADYPDISASAVIGCPDALWGERVLAVVELQAQALADEVSIINFCRQHLASYKCPKEVIFVNVLPRNAMGKIQKTQLRAKFCNQEKAS